MSMLADIRPSKFYRVIDLVREAGVDVTGWANFKGGEADAARNPKYCYNWAFIQPAELVVLTLWYSKLTEEDGAITWRINLREDIAFLAREQKSSTWFKRAHEMNDLIELAFVHGLPIRAIICDGKIGDSRGPYTSASRVDRRILDPEPWGVKDFDPDTGGWVLERGLSRFVRDQFSLKQSPNVAPSTRQVTITTIVRSGLVRRRVLDRSGGHCELCGEPGFKMSNGGVYLETHHLTPLSENGLDIERNMAALCPNHHREAHHGAERDQIRARLALKIGQ